MQQVEELVRHLPVREAKVGLDQAATTCQQLEAEVVEVNSAVQITDDLPGVVSIL